MAKKKKEKDSLDQTVITSISKVVGQQPKRAYILFLAGPLLGKLYALEEGVSILGRNPDAGIVVNDSRISRNHLQIKVDGEVALIEDLDSTNGTFVNGNRITEHVLHDDDKIQISPSTIFKFALADESEKIFHDELYKMGVVDPVTNVYNKRYFTERLKQEFSHSKRAKLSMSLLMIDIDFFKKINDSYGHLAGDFVLGKLAKILESMTRHEDIVARYGGEEFAAVLRGTDEDGATMLAERMRNAVASTPIEFEGKDINMAISIGVASLVKGEGFETTEDFIATADKCLYYSKQHGRNRTTNPSQIG